MLMDQDQEVSGPVSTGFEELEASPAVAEAVSEQPIPVAQTEPTSAPSADPTEPTPQPQTTEVAPEPEVTAQQARDDFVNIVAQGPGADQSTAQRNQEIFDAIVKARNAPPAVAPVQPAIPRVLSQTKLEMAEGARQSARHKAAQGRVVHAKPAPREAAAQGSSTPVYRPTDSVPNMNSKSDVQRGHKVL